MKFSIRKAAFLLLLLAGLFLVLLNWPLVMSEFIQPVSLVIWLVLRTFVLSVDQQYYWWGLIFVVVIFLFRLIPHAEPVEEETQANSFNETIRSIEHWRTLFIPDENSRYHDQFLEREFTHLLVTMYAAHLHVASDYHLHEQLREGEIPLPENIRSFIFKENKIPEKRTVKSVIRSIWTAPRRWWDESAARKKAENNRTIEEILAFFETTLEIDHDDR
jgi:hypothetical protein